MNLALKIDIDTYIGATKGLKNLLSILSENDIPAAVFFSLGPDNMGKNIWRIFKPDFLNKIIRTNAVSIYDCKNIIRGIFSCGPIIYKDSIPLIKETANLELEIGLHAWNHYDWQTNINNRNEKQIYEDIERGYDILTQITGKNPTASAAPAWKVTDTALKVKDLFNFQYNCDCRGEGIFNPVVGDIVLKTPQISQNLPVYDEIIGSDSISHDNYNSFLLNLIDKNENNLLTIHTEIEGLYCFELFKEFIKEAKKRHINFVFPSYYLPNNLNTKGYIIKGKTKGREGWVSMTSGLYN